MLTREHTVLVVVDVQGNLSQAMHEQETLLQQLQTIIQGFQALEVPLVVTEQYPRGLGPTVPEIARLIPDVQPISKVAFSCCGEERFMHQLHSLNRQQVVIVGIEAHVCVYQTAVELVSMGYEVEVVVDAVSSRTPANKAIGLSRIREGGAGITGVETVLFELLKEAGGPAFKAIQRLIK
jgi:nicotinamidase-related amidase